MAFIHLPLIKKINKHYSIESLWITPIIKTNQHVQTNAQTHMPPRRCSALICRNSNNLPDISRVLQTLPKAKTQINAERLLHLLTYITWHINSPCSSGKLSLHTSMTPYIITCFSLFNSHRYSSGHTTWYVLKYTNTCWLLKAHIRTLWRLKSNTVHKFPAFSKPKKSRIIFTISISHR